MTATSESRTRHHYRARGDQLQDHGPEKPGGHRRTRAVVKPLEWRRNQDAADSSHWVKVKGKDTTPLADEVIFDQADYSVTEGGTVTLGLSRYAIEDSSLNTAIRISLKETSGTATVWADYNSLNNVRYLDTRMAADVTTVSESITTNNDKLVEPDETLQVTISRVSEGFSKSLIFRPGNPSTATVTIVDDDRANAKIAFGDDATSTTKYTATVAEVDGTLNVPVTVSHLPGASTTFAVEVLSGSTATENSDYSIATKSVTFGPTDSSKTKNVAITLTDEIDYEADETIELRIVAADATVDDLGDYYARDAAGATATVTVTSADPQKAYALYYSAASVTEGGNAELTLKLSENAPTGGLAFTVTPTYASGAGKAAAADLSSPPAKVKVAENQQTATLSIPIAADGLVEDTETFTVTVTADDAGWSLASGRVNEATITIEDDDRANAKIAFGSDAASTTKYTATVSEAVSGGTLNVPVTVSHLPGASTTFTVELLSGGTATEGSDFSIATKSVTFGPSDSSKTKNVAITLTDDSDYEKNETIKLRIVAADDPVDDLGDHYGRHSAGATATITVTSDELRIAFGTDAGATTKYTATVAEDVRGRILNVPVTVSHRVASTTTFAVEVLPGGTATEGSDFEISYQKRDLQELGTLRQELGT